MRLTRPSNLAPELLRSEALQRFDLGPGTDGDWFRLDGSRLAKPPEGLPIDQSDDLPEDGPSHLNSISWMVETPRGRLRVLADGLYLVRSKNEKVKLGEGQFASPVVSPDGRYALVSQSAGEGWLEPNSLVRLDLKSGKTDPVHLEAADNLFCVAYVPERGFLVLSARDDDDGYRPESRGPEKPEFYLVNESTGDCRRVEGEFAPCLTLERRPLQPTGKPGEFWATRRVATGTELGRYKLREFTFEPVDLFSGIAVSSHRVWVDEKGRRVYVLMDGNLLELPLRDTPSWVPAL